MFDAELQLSDKLSHKLNRECKSQEDSSELKKSWATPELSTLSVINTDEQFVPIPLGS